MQYNKEPPGELRLVVMRRCTAPSWLEAILLHFVVCSRGRFCAASSVAGRNEVVKQVWIQGENKSPCCQALEASLLLQYRGQIGPSQTLEISILETSQPTSKQP